MTLVEFEEVVLMADGLVVLTPGCWFEATDAGDEADCGDNFIDLFTLFSDVDVVVDAGLDADLGISLRIRLWYELEVFEKGELTNLF